MRESFVIYTELNEAIQDMSDEIAGALFKAIMAYNTTGEVPEMSAVVQMAFSIIKPQFDKNNQKWEETKAKREERARNAANSRWNKESIEHENNACECSSMLEHENNACDANNVNVNVDVNVSAKADKSISAHAHAKKYGAYGWIKLTDEQYNRLAIDLGQSELDRCIAYVDESAQSTGNKNKWRDWNVVIRKCSRDKWGLYGRDRPKKAVNPYLELLKEEAANGQSGNFENPCYLEASLS